MKRILLTLALVLALALPAGAVIEYVDFDNGDDDTGDGTYSSPWATIGKCTTSKTGGDECRVAKHTPTALSGTLTFTNGSTSVSTSVDLTGDVSAGDHVGLNATDESWWRVASITSDTITLDFQYWGPGTGSATAGYETTYSQLVGDIDINSSGVSSANRLKISGGWDLTTQTQDGKTFLSHSGNSFYIMALNGKDYFEFSDFVVQGGDSTFYNTISGSASGSLLKDLIWVNNDLPVFSGEIVSAWNSYENIIQSGGPAGAFSVSSTLRYANFINCTSYSPGDDSADYALEVSNAYFVRASGVSIYNSYETGIYIYASGHVYLDDIVVDTTRYTGSKGLQVYGAYDVKVSGIAISDTIGDGINVVNNSFDVFIYAPVFSGIGGDEVTHADDGDVFTVESYDGTAGDDRIYPGGYGYFQRDTTDARSGTGLKAFPSSSIYPITYKIGSVKVTDGGTNLTLSAYMKDDASFNGEVVLYALCKGKMISFPEVKTMTTSYVEQSITVSSDDISTDDYVHLYVGVTGTAGSVYVDDFSSTN